MPVNATFTVLYGAQSEGPLCYLLQLPHGFTFLLDCGWDDAFDLALLQPVLSRLPQVDAVLLSHSDTAHIGALPYLVGRAGLAAPVYATLPVVKMGTMEMYDHHISRNAVGEFDVYSLDDVDAAFSKVVQVKYHQTLRLTGRGEGMCITPYAAGRLMGGAVWHVTLPGGEELVYAVDYSITKERHLAGSQLDSLFSRPALMITDAYSALAQPTDRGRRDALLLDALLGALRGDGQVLMPVATAGRTLELVLMLEAAWQEHRLPYPLVLMTSVAYSTLEFARSMLEWTNDAICRAFETRRDNAFQCRHLRFAASLADLQALPAGPKVVLASLPSLEAGMARELLLQWAPDHRNLLLLTQRPPAGSLADELLRHAAAAEGRPPGVPPPPPPVLELVVTRRVALQGEELREHELRKAAEEAAAAAARADAADAAAADFPLRANSVALSRLVKDASGGLRQVLPHEAFAGMGPRAEGWADSADAGVLLDGFEPPTDAFCPMFADEVEHLQGSFDAYGEVLDAAMFAQADAEGAAGVGDDDDEDDADGLSYDPPTKVVSERLRLTCTARCSLVDFEGRSDGRSARSILVKVAPRELVLVHGSPESTAAAATAAAAELSRMRGTVHAPSALQPLQLPMFSGFGVELAQALAGGLRMHRLGPYSLAWLDGVFAPLPAKEGEAAAAGGAGVSGGGGEAVGGGGGEAAGGDGSSAAAVAAPPPALQLVPATDGSSSHEHGGIFIGDVKLSEVKLALAAVGIPAEFRAGGALMAAGGVLVRRAPAGAGGGGGGSGGNEGRLVLEGPLCEEYFRVRDVVYGQYNVC